MVYIFNGKDFALKKEINLAKEVKRLSEKGITPKLVSIIIGDDPASHLYVNLKKKAGERVGIKVKVLSLSSSVTKNEIKKIIHKLNRDKLVHGIMVQLPLPKDFSEKDGEEILFEISKEKDVDGLRGDSTFIHPTVKAILEIMSIGEEYVHHNNYPYIVSFVGASGFVGGHFIKEAKKLNQEIYKVIGLNKYSRNLDKYLKESDIIISATGVPGLIKESMVKKGVVLVDVGSPKGDIKKEAYKKAGFVSPSPGGVGPVTISCLLENVLFASKNV